MYVQDNIKGGTSSSEGSYTWGGERMVGLSSCIFRLSDMADIPPGGFKIVAILEWYYEFLNSLVRGT